jgi:hypothetical protein
MTVPYTFGTESSPIPLSQLDANFAVLPTYANTAGNVANAAQPNITSVGTLVALSVTGNVIGGNVRTAGGISAVGNVTVGNITTGGVISAYGTVTGGSFTTGGNIGGNNISITNTLQVTGNVTAGNIITPGLVSAIGDISTQGNIIAQGVISATGNIVTAGKFVGAFQGSIVGNVTGNFGSNTQVLYNNNGNIGASGGLTYTTSPNALGILGTVSAQGNVTGGNLRINGTTQLIGAATAPTAPVNTANNQVATTAFVNNQITAIQANSLGTIASQNANNVSITGGVITNMPAVNLSGGWTITPNGNALYFGFGGSNVAKLDSLGNFTTIGNITGSGTL